MTFQTFPVPKPSRNPIYLQDWWWGIAAGEQQRFVAVYENDREVGRLLYFHQTRTFLRICKLAEGVHAPWTNYCAPNINNKSDELDATRQDEIAYKLARQLPRNMSYRLTCPHFMDRAVLTGFERAGFMIGTQKSYLIDLRGAGTEAILARLDMSTRQRYRKAEKRLDVVEIDSSTLFRLYRRDLATRNKTSYQDLNVAERLAASCQARGPGCIRITAAKCKDALDDDDRSYHAAIACLQDDAFSYYWMSTRNVDALDPAIRNGAVKFLLVDAIAHASQASLIFDFDGAASNGSGELYRGFRGREVSRYVLTRGTISARVVDAVRAFYRPHWR
jgi:hypothetical protein